VTPEAARFLAKSLQFLAKADGILAAGWPDEAGRAAYLAAFHAAQALIFERRDDVPKTHAGVHAVFGEVARDAPAFERPLRAFLRRAHVLKARADYGLDESVVVTRERAAEAIAEARRFVAAVEALVAAAGGGGGTAPPPGQDRPRYAAARRASWITSSSAGFTSRMKVSSVSTTTSFGVWA
jgi:uncharacterized protein (UPF0332 family)